jgi:hypothetical protein
MINPHKTFKNILKQWGHNILIQRLTDPSCMKYDSKLQRYTTRSYYPGSSGFANAMQEKTQGLTVSSEVIYYLQDFVNPKSGDRIYEELPTGNEIFKIDFAAPVRGRGGKIVYWIAGATKEETPNA